MLGRSTLSHQSKEKGHQVRAIGAVEHVFNGTAIQAKALASNRLAKAKRASQGPSVSPQSQAEEKVKKTLENPP